MDTILVKAKLDLEQKQAKLNELTASLEGVRAEVNALHEFIERAERYAGLAFPIRSDIPVPQTTRKTVQRVPYEGSKRWVIGNAALEALATEGRPLTTKELMGVIDTKLLEPSLAPQNYLSNALSKDARFVSTDRGWARNTSLRKEDV